MLIVLKQVLDVRKAFDLKDLRLLLNHLPAGAMERQLVSSEFLKHFFFFSEPFWVEASLGVCKTP